MDCLVDMTTPVPPGTSADAVDEIRAREAVHNSLVDSVARLDTVDVPTLTAQLSRADFRRQP